MSVSSRDQTDIEAVVLGNADAETEARIKALVSSDPACRDLWQDLVAIRDGLQFDASSHSSAEVPPWFHERAAAAIRSAGSERSRSAPWGFRVACWGGCCGLVLVALVFWDPDRFGLSSGAGQDAMESVRSQAAGDHRSLASLRKAASESSDRLDQALAQSPTRGTDRTIPSARLLDASRILEELDRNFEPFSQAGVLTGEFQ